MIKLLLAASALSITLVGYGQSGKDFWGDLPAGKYQPAFKRYYTSNPTRTFVDSCRSATQISARPEIINVWYPTTEKTGQRLTIKDLLTYNSGNKVYQGFDSALTANHHKNAMLYTYGDRNNEKATAPVNEWTSKTKSEFQSYLSLITRSLIGKPIAKGRFPVIVYHQGLGGTPDDAFLLCEFFASHGFIVVNTAYQSNICSRLNTSWNFDITFNEIDFLVNFVDRQIPNADISRLIGIGHSYGASAMLAYSSVSSTPFIAFLIFDSTADYEKTYTHSGFAQLKQRIYPRIQNITRPLFLVARETATFRIIDSLKNCDRYYLKVPAMSHEDFTSQGAVAKYLQLKSYPDSAELKIPYLNHLVQLQASLEFVNAILEKRPVNINKEVTDKNKIVFEMTPKGISKY
ncbi:MAG TPA: hypothetical protein VGO58_05460 [Chitinophagaceae bacterium]|jgi:hypothetical protein|nr:hypothetical protein [Chitinophagaceae bacterium]